MRERAFTLVEIAIAIVIVGILAGATFALGQAQIYNAKYNLTVSRLEVIEEALLTFLSLNGRLPCPAYNSVSPSNSLYGFEQITSNSGAPQTCNPASNGIFMISGTISGQTTYYGGAIPFRTLNLANEFMFDGWGNQIYYRVLQPFINSDATNSLCITAEYASQSTASQYQCFRAQASASASYPYGLSIQRVIGGANVIYDAVYVLISFGSDGYGAYRYVGYGSPSSQVGSANPASSSANEFENEEIGSGWYLTVTTGYQYSSGVYSYNAPFDDIVHFKSRNNMVEECNRRYQLVCSVNWGIQFS